LGLLVVCLVAVVGLAKTVSPAIESGVAAIGAPQSVVGMAIALTVIVGVLTLGTGRATLLQGGVHLVIFSGFRFLAITP
jgi:Ca2+:H+ antiporter